MSYVILIVELASAPGVDSRTGCYVKSSDPDGAEGMGTVVLTRSVDEAQRFWTYGQAFEAWRAQSTVMPLRPDGKPNRPMTAYTVEIMEIRRAKQAADLVRVALREIQSTPGEREREATAVQLFQAEVTSV